MTFQLFHTFKPEIEPQSAAQDFYSLVERLRKAVHYSQPEWATYPNFVQYAEACFWAIRKQEYSFITNAFARLEAETKQPFRVLDVGCGVVPLCNWMSRRGHNVTAIDPLQADIDFLVKNDLNAFYNSQVTYLNSRAEQLPFEDASFDVVTCVSVLEHIPPGNDRITLWEIARVLKPAGYLLITFDVAPRHVEQVGEKEPGPYLRRFTYPFSPAAAGRLLEEISPFFDVSSADLPPELTDLTWEQVHDFWKISQIHDKRDESYREYLAMGRVLQRLSKPVVIPKDILARAYLEGQASLEERIDFYQWHAEARLRLINQLEGQLEFIQRAAEERLVALNEKEQALVKMYKVAEERLGLINRFDSEIKLLEAKIKGFS